MKLKIIFALTLTLLAQSLFVAKAKALNLSSSTPYTETEALLPEPPFTEIGRVALERERIAGGGSVRGKIVLDAVLSVDVSLVLTSDASGVRFSDSTIKIPRNQRSSEAFTVITSPVAQLVRGTIRARIDLPSGLPPLRQPPEIRSATLSIVPRLKGIRLNKTRVVGGSIEGLVTGTVELEEPAPAGGIRVGVRMVTTSATSGESVSLLNDVTVNQGNREATFLISTRRTTQLLNVTVIAFSGGAETRATLVVMPLAIASVDLGENKVGGSLLGGAITLNGPAFSDSVITLRSSNANVLKFVAPNAPPAGTDSLTLNLTEGKIIQTFLMQTFPVTQNTQVNVLILLNGVVSTSETITVRRQP